jgi:hypothetical protein
MSRILKLRKQLEKLEKNMERNRNELSKIKKITSTLIWRKAWGTQKHDQSIPAVEIRFVRALKGVLEKEIKHKIVRDEVQK